MKKILIICLVLLGTILPTFADKYDDPNYSRIKMIKGYEFAEKIKQAVRNKDIYFFANHMPHYPIDFYDQTCNENNHIVIINSKEEFISLYKEKLFTKDFVNDICNEELFVSWRGFMMGHGEILFDYDEDSQNITPKIKRIIILNYSNYSEETNISWVKVGEGIYFNPKSLTFLHDGIRGDFKIMGNNICDAEDIAYSIQTIKVFNNNTYMILNWQCYDRNNDFINMWGTMGYSDDTKYSCYEDERSKIFHRTLIERKY